jgi:hypothetical protein
VPIHLPLLTVKMLAVLTYAGGAMGRFLATEPALQKRAVHAIASPAMVVVWISGLGLAEATSVSFGEAWVLGGMALSLVSLMALIYSVARPVSTPTGLAAVAIPIVIVLVLMIYRPRWSDV